MADLSRDVLSDTGSYKQSLDVHMPCFKHATENLSQKSKPAAVPGDKICNSCSKTMLSYIFMVQDVLDGLARKLSTDEGSTCCMQCLRQESRHVENLREDSPKSESLQNLNGIHDGELKIPSSTEPESQTKQKQESSVSPAVNDTGEATPEPKRPRKTSSRRNSRRVSREIRESGAYSENCVSKNGWQTDFLYNVSSSIEPKYAPYLEQRESSEDSIASNKRNEDVSGNHNASFMGHSSRSNSSDSPPPLCSPPKADFRKSPEGAYKKEDSSNSSIDALDYKSEKNLNVLKLDNSCAENNLNHFEADDSSRTNIESLEGELDNVKLKYVQQSVENRIPLFDSFSKRDRKSSEAFVTICRNNAEALGCLVLGSSLLLNRTPKQLCVLVGDDVDPLFKKPFSSIFHVVQYVKNVNSIDENIIEHLKQMNLEKLSVWCLIQFSKCVFLNPDCLVVQNCDELFQHAELSAIPDTGWPDCFNAGVFVFTPSIDTLSELWRFSQQQGENNGGDQMVLNAHFHSWSSDAGKKLSFTYNLMRNASYTYGPAFEKFGLNAKIVQFLGGPKPWEVKFFSQTGQIDGNSEIHPKHVRFFSEWINIFKITILKLLPQDAYTYAFTQNSISAEDVALFLCLPGHSDQETVMPFHILPERETVSPLAWTDPPRKTTESNFCTPTPVLCQTPDGILKAEDAIPDRALPGAAVGDYKGMKAWEQGFIDYQGCDSSENIMNRLSVLIHRYV